MPPRESCPRHRVARNRHSHRLATSRRSPGDGLGVLAFAIRRVGKPDRRRRATTCGALVAHIRPQASGLGFTLAGASTAIGVSSAWILLAAMMCCRNRLTNGCKSRLASPTQSAMVERSRTRPHAHRFRTADTAADDPRIWTPAHGPTIPARQDPGNRSARGRHLHDPVTAAAGQLGPHVANHLEARRHVLQNFGHVIAQMTKFAATAWALRIGSMDVDFTGQMLGQWLAAYGCTWARLGWWWRGQCGLADLQLFERQLQLVEHAIELLGTPTELHAPQLGDHQFQVLDFPALGGNQGFQGLDVVRKEVGRASHGAMLLVFSSVEHQTARTGAVRSGRRQSMPSNSIASCAVVKETLPLVACGQTKRPCSPLAEQAQAIAIPPQQFDPVTAPSPKHEDLAGERIRLKLGLHQGRQAIEPRRMSVAPATIQMRVPMGGAIIATPAARPVARFAGRARPQCAR